MRPSFTDPFGSNVNEHGYRTRLQESESSNLRRLRTEDSWIEVSTHPSPSSLLTSPNDVVSADRTLRQFTPQPDRQAEVRRSASVAGSSQDEYEDSESESDRVMTSSNEEIGREDENNRATGNVQTQAVFTPQPNAFSHPPSRTSARNSFQQTPSTPASVIRSETPQRPRHHLDRERLSTGSFQPDHDAALRASLTTLLSCAAAVRPKSEEKTVERVPIRRPSTQPTALRLVQESELEQPTSSKPTKRRSRESSKERQTKRTRAAKPAIVAEEMINPTIASWVISAGVVLLFSAISFSAGYAWGREVGRFEGEMGLNSSSCGSEALRGGGLRRLRWTTTSGSVRA